MDARCCKCRTLRYPLYVLSAIAIANVMFVAILVGTIDGLVPYEHIYSE